MNRKRFQPSAYLVEWATEGIVKAGYTAGRRWTAFVNRGATLHLLIGYPSGLDALILESELDEILRRHLQPAFPMNAAAKTRAALILGGGGGGYMECRKGSPDAVSAALTACREHAASNAPSSTHHLARALTLEQCTNERNGRTNGDSLVEVDGSLQVADVRARTSHLRQDRTTPERAISERAEAQEGAA